MWNLYNDPQGKKIFRDIETTIAEGKHETLSVRNSIPTERGEERIVKELEDRNRELEELNMNLVQRSGELEERCRAFDSTNVVRRWTVLIVYDESRSNNVNSRPWRTYMKTHHVLHIKHKSEEKQCQ